MTSRNWCLTQDAADPLATFRARFTLPEGVIYLDGNSLGAMPAAAPALAAETVTQEWGDGLVRSWNDANWFDLPVILGNRIAPFIGADPGEVVVCDSTSINLFKVLNAAIGLRPGRSTILMLAGDFPTDGYIASGMEDKARIRYLPREELAAAIDSDTIALCLVHTHYKSGALFDMAELTAAAHVAGALAIWDLSHSTGAMPLAVNQCGVDFAVGSTYKYLNGGPGSPAFLFAAQRHLSAARQPLQGWTSHADPFGFDPDYHPAPDIRRFTAGTPYVASMALIAAGLDTFDAVDMVQVRAKSMAMGDAFIQMVEARCPELKLASPREAAQRGSQVSFTHPHAYALSQALVEAGVIGDFRTPDAIRFGLTPLYLRYIDLWDAVTIMAEVLTSDRWRDPRFAVRNTVT